MRDPGNIVNHFPGQGSTYKETASANPPAWKPSAYRPPYAYNAAAIQSLTTVRGVSYNGELNEVQLINKKQIKILSSSKEDN
ncbi:Uncharacterized protein TCM_019877 [Theobroma cacao]|uniref:Uncharacterized protein n=1 Tax=Theobroma cacao TaxID=3641 RepID=A0A061EIM6_THECC|nr:Uncharacterized protein TCM_019877 [Theobroma cacao]